MKPITGSHCDPTKKEGADNYGLPESSPTGAGKCWRRVQHRFGGTLRHPSAARHRGQQPCQQKGAGKRRGRQGRI